MNGITAIRSLAGWATHALRPVTVCHVQAAPWLQPQLQARYDGSIASALTGLASPNAPYPPKCCIVRTAASLSGGVVTAAAPAPFKLVVYSKEDCPLCDKLKEKLESIMDRAAFMPSVLSGVELEVRDISSNPAWEAAYSMSVPVMAAALPDGSNEVSLSFYSQ